MVTGPQEGFLRKNPKPEKRIDRVGGRDCPKSPLVAQDCLYRLSRSTGLPLARQGIDPPGFVPCLGFALR